MTPAPSSRTWLLFLGGAEVALLGAMGWIPGARSTPFPALALYGAAFATYAAAALWLLRRPSAAGRREIWAVGITGRLLLLPLLPHFSDDIWRYLWDGWVQTQGVNPYVHAPDAAALEGFRTEWHHLINHPDVSTIYPPAAQLVFLALATLAASPFVFKAVWIVADLAAAWIVERLGRRRTGEGRAALLLYLWSPLLLVEVAWSGHLEPLGMLPMLGTLWLVGERRAGAEESGGGGRGGSARTEGERRRGLLGGASLAAATAVKLGPAAGLPALVRRNGWRAGAGFGAVLALVSLPYVGAGDAIFAGLVEYVRRWSFHPGPHALLALLPGGGTMARWAAGLAVGAVALAAAWRRWSLERALFWTLGAGLLLSPTLHPWYLLWILPLAALRGSRGWILFTGLAFLSYAHLDRFLATGQWPQPAWLAALMWVPPLALLAVDAARGRRSGA